MHVSAYELGTDIELQRDSKLTVLQLDENELRSRIFNA